MQQYNSSKQHRYKNWFKQRYKQDHKKFPVVKPNVARHDPVEGRRLYNLSLRMLTEKHNDEKLVRLFWG